jgi:hypothetical protein
MPQAGTHSIDRLGLNSQGARTIVLQAVLTVDCRGVEQLAVDARRSSAHVEDARAAGQRCAIPVLFVDVALRPLRREALCVPLVLLQATQIMSAVSCL